MNTAAAALITDAKQAFGRQIEEGAARDSLVAAFAGWLRLADIKIPVLAELAAVAAKTKGASRTYRDVAVLGFAVTDPNLRVAHGASFCVLLEWLMGRPFRLGGDPTPMLSDPAAVLGTAVGGRACLTGAALGRFELWIQGVEVDTAKMLRGTGWPNILAGAIVTTSMAPDSEWIYAGLGTRLAEFVPGKPDLAQIIRQTVNGAHEVASPSEAALRLAALRWASVRALDINIGAIAVADVACIMERIGSVFSRWVWEDNPRTTRKGAEARKWHIENEYHFQSLLFAVLKPILPELEEEQYLASTGQVQPRADLCLMSLGLLIEVKFWYRRDPARRIIEEVAADVTLYLKSEAPYTSLVVAIWDDGARTEDHEALKRGLGGLAGIRGVIVINRPSWMG